MPELRISSTTSSDMTNRVTDVTVSSQDLDSPSSLKETEWTNSKATQWLGYYKTIPEVKTAIDMRAIWTIGKGYQADPDTSVILDHISGWGNETFNSILKNMVTMKRVCGDAFAEIIRADDGTLINLKPLNPSSMKIVTNDKGVIIRYEQMNTGKNGQVTKYKPEEILHFTNKRVGDEIHGVSDIEAIENIILANVESFSDMKQLQHRFVRPRFHVELDTDDVAKINEFVAKFDQITQKGENIFTPAGAVKSVNVLAVPANATLNPLPWREHLRSYFYQVVGIPQIILGSSGEFTESTAKIAYLAFEQSVDDEQNEIEAAIWNQLYLRITLSFPASLKNELLSDEAKDADQGMEFQPSDTTAGIGR